MIITEKRVVNFLRTTPFFTPQQNKVLRERGNEASKCLDCYCFKCTSDCEKINGKLLPFCPGRCTGPISPKKVRKCFKF